MSPHTLTALEWSNTALSAAGAWLVGGRSRRQAHAGFWLFMAANADMAAWSTSLGHWGILTTQLFFVVTSMRGIASTRRRAADDAP